VTAALPRSAPADSELLASIAKGNLEALGALFDRYEPDVKRFVARLGANASDVDDLVQATFLDVVCAARRFDPELPVKGWLFGIAATLVRRERRSLARAAARLLRFASLATADEPAPTPAALLESDRELESFQRAFERLAPKKREVFALVVLEGMSGEDVAKALGIPVNTVWTRLHHARRELRAALGAPR
jgi:RNA polymerase sigma factor (sigma-70 family)